MNDKHLRLELQGGYTLGMHDPNSPWAQPIMVFNEQGENQYYYGQTRLTEGQVEAMDHPQSDSMMKVGGSLIFGGTPDSFVVGTIGGSYSFNTTGSRATELHLGIGTALFPYSDSINADVMALVGGSSSLIQADGLPALGNSGYNLGLRSYVGRPLSTEGKRGEIGLTATYLWNGAGHLASAAATFRF